MTKRIKGYLFIGKIEINSGIKASDPCYDNDTWCTLDVPEAERGTYNCYIKKFDEASNNNRMCVASLLIMKEDSKSATLPKDFLASIGVDAGVCGFFDIDYFKKVNVTTEIKDEWYKREVIDTIGEDYHFCENQGVFTTSGFGDGSYGVFGRKNSENKIDALMIKYL